MKRDTENQTQGQFFNTSLFEQSNWKVYVHTYILRN